MQGKILTLDVGNTTLDACIWKGNKLLRCLKLRHEDIYTLEGNYARVLCVSVKPSITSQLRELFGNTLKLLGLEDIPLEVEYRSKDTLGIDRVINAFGVREFYSENAVVVSCGTALVVDLLKGGIFKGGFITAGMGLKLKALYEFTEGIPLYSLKKIRTDYGSDSEEAVLGGIITEVLALIDRCKDRWGVDEVIITGGEGWLIEETGIYDSLLSHKALMKLGGKTPRL